MMYKLAVWTSYRDPARKSGKVSLDDLKKLLDQWFADPSAVAFQIEVLDE